ncbi:MAG: glycerol kinase [Candidatus Lokiarchaeota archaeon]|nr:glycerol kinase [Candidatus Lokiarchaeota archaeon]MBD3340666.1 glycerol kinase [Candidatus Lokiarchaeota archaeon]
MVEKKYVLTLDLGTTNIKAILFDKKGEIFSEARRRPNYIMDESGKVEQDPKEIWKMSKESIEEVLSSNNLKDSDIDAIAISTQRASFTFWDKKTGKLYSNIISWQDKRSAEFAEKLSNKFFFKFLRGFAKVASIFGSTKMLTASMLQFPTDYASVRTAYFLDQNPDIKEKINNPDTNIVWGQLDSWILWNLTEGRLHATDYSNASSSAMLDPFSLEWNKPILKPLGIPTHILPELKETKDDFGVSNLFGDSGIPIRAIIADQQASLFGQCCFNFGDMKVTNGTGSFVDINTGNEPFASKRRLYPMVAWKIDGEATYMLEGMSHNTGNIIDWIQNELGLFDDPAETEKMALTVGSSEGVYFVPTFSSGISYPYWDSTARGNLFGISLTTKKEHIIRAVLNGICYRIKDFVEGIKQDTGIDVKIIKADGGVSQNKYILQRLSDMLDMEVEHSQNPEITALGAAFIAGLSTGFWSSREELRAIRKVEKKYHPQMSQDDREERYDFWKDIVSRSLNYKSP